MMQQQKVVVFDEAFEDCIVEMEENRYVYQRFDHERRYEMEYCSFKIDLDGHIIQFQTEDDWAGPLPPILAQLDRLTDVTLQIRVVPLDGDDSQVKKSPTKRKF